MTTGMTIQAYLDQVFRRPLPMRYSSGFMLGRTPVGMYGRNSHYAFGHAGFANIFCWVDPQRDIAVSIMTTGKPILGPHVPALLKLIHNISSRCVPAPGYAQVDPIRRGRPAIVD